jgi:hypothetical protein
MDPLTFIANIPLRRLSNTQAALKFQLNWNFIDLSKALLTEIPVSAGYSQIRARISTGRATIRFR